MADLVQRYSDRIVGVLSCYDRVIVRGRIPGLDYAKGMEQHLRAREIRLFDFPKFGMPFREAIGNNAEQLAQANGIKIQFIRNSDVRKEDVVAKVLEQCGDSPGLVAILSALEVCPSFEARYDKTTGRTSLRPDRGKCLYFNGRGRKALFMEPADRESDRIRLRDAGAVRRRHLRQLNTTEARSRWMTSSLAPW